MKLDELLDDVILNICVWFFFSLAITRDAISSLATSLATLHSGEYRRNQSIDFNEISHMDVD